jgi:glutamine synthetase
MFLFFCTAVIAGVDKHQALLRASVANAGQDHRLGANEAPPAIISIFLGAELERVFAAIEAGEEGQESEQSFLRMGTPVLPRLPMHGGDRNRTSPFAFTGNKFEFRALGSSHSLGFPNTVLNTIAAEAIDMLSDRVEQGLQSGKSMEDAVVEVVRQTWTEHKRIVFDGDNYSEEWEQEAARRGLENLRSTPDALPWLVHEQTVQAFSRYEVLSERELEARYEVFLEQYFVKLNIEAETAASMARTMLLPAAVRHLASLRQAQVPTLIKETEALVNELVDGIRALEHANLDPDLEGMELARYMRDTVYPAMMTVRETADRLEGIVADDLWPLPKYEEMLFIK